MKGKCLQIGIHTAAEYIYLAYPNWKNEASIHQEFFLKPIIEEFGDVTKWDYIGIDLCPLSISMMIREYFWLTNAKWLSACIAGTSKKRLVERESFFKSGVSDNKHISNFISPVLSLDELLLSIDGDIDILAMDIEADEIEVFKNCQWQKKPKYISVECHCLIGCTDSELIESRKVVAKEIQTYIEKHDYVSEIRETEHGHVELTSRLKL